jgi:hypothetical protein
MNNSSCKQVKKRGNNPTGRGGFQFHPELRCNGRWKKEDSISYWLNFFLRLTVTDFKNYENTKPEIKRTVAESISYARVFNARGSLKESQYVTNRTEGLPRQSTEMISDNGRSDYSHLSEEELDEKILELSKKIERARREERLNKIVK